MNKFIITLFTIFMGIFGIIYVLNNQTKSITNEGVKIMDELNYIRISPEKFLNDIKNMNKEDYVVLDVRTKEEYDEERLQDAVLVSLDNIEDVEDIILDKDKRIYVYCRSGRRSMSAAYKLLEMGYTDVVDIGGIEDYPYEKIKGK